MYWIRFLKFFKLFVGETVELPTIWTVPTQFLGLAQIRPGGLINYSNNPNLEIESVRVSASPLSLYSQGLTLISFLNQHIRVWIGWDSLTCH